MYRNNIIRYFLELRVLNNCKPNLNYCVIKNGIINYILL